MTEDTELLRKDLVTAFEHLLSCWSRLENLFTKQQLQTAEARRVKAILERDRADAARERMRQEAVIELAKGVFVNLSDTVLEPTPEWLGQGETKRYTPRQPDGTVREIATVRRVETPVVVRLHQSGKVTDEQAVACLWYQRIAAVAGMDGRCAASQWNATSTIRRGAVESGFGYVPAAVAVAEARDLFRKARAAMPANRLRFFDAVVLDDLPLMRACRFAQCDNSRASHRFRKVANALVVFCQREKVTMPDGED